MQLRVVCLLVLLGVAIGLLVHLRHASLCSTTGTGFSATYYCFHVAHSQTNRTGPDAHASPDATSSYAFAEIMTDEKEQQLPPNRTVFMSSFGVIRNRVSKNRTIAICITGHVRAFRYRFQREVMFDRLVRPVNEDADVFIVLNNDPDGHGWDPLNENELQQLQDHLHALFKPVVSRVDLGAVRRQSLPSYGVPEGMEMINVNTWIILAINLTFSYV